MASGGGGGTQTVEPPKWQRPFIQTGLSEAQNLYNRTAPTGISFEQFQNPALLGMVNQAQGNPLTGAQQDLATKTLQGGFLGSNPHLDATFNQAALATQNQLASQFAGAGRNIGASRGLRSQELNDLATNIYGGAYDAERNRQQQVLGMSPALQQSGYGDLDRLLGVSQSSGNQLDDFLGRVSTGYGQQSHTSQSSNPWGGALGGAMMGSALGPWGALAGGVLGGLGSL